MLNCFLIFNLFYISICLKPNLVYFNSYIRPSGISRKKIGKLRGTYKKLCGIVRHYESIARQIAWHFVFVITPNICRIMKENMFNNN